MAKPILIAGPTASGKSGLAIALAQRLGGVVINADSQQVFADWRILTARPSPDEEARAPHRLYGHLPLTADYSVGAWLRDLAPVLAETAEAKLRPIIVGGTGLYFRALTEGLVKIPATPPEVRRAGEAELERAGIDAFAAALARRDPETAERIDLSNPARVLRAWEVLEATGTPLADWQDRTPRPLLSLSRSLPVALTPPRDTVRARCDTRLDVMIAEGVLDEVARVMALGLPASAPGMKALGAPEFMGYLRGEIPLDEAGARARSATRRYAKRQLTWVRNQMAGWTHISAPDPDAVIALVRRRE